MHVRPARSLAAASALALSCYALTACDAGSALPGGDDGGADQSQDEQPASQGKARFTTNLGKNTSAVPVNTQLVLSATNAEYTKVRVTSSEGNLPGGISDDGGSWTASDLLEPGVTYAVATQATDGKGENVRRNSTFTTQALTLDQQTYASVAPLQGETVGVGMPVVVNFDVPVTDKAAFEKHMTVTTSPAQPGAWRWVSDNVAHYRPKAYWKSGTRVTVDVDVNGVPAGNGIYGQEDRSVDFEIGDANIYRVDAASHQMKVFSNGKLIRTIPITTGKPGFTTRSGTKVIMEKYLSKRMNSETVGIARGSAEAYDIDNVQYAMRVTSSGEFIHAAPWSVGSQGNANVSHGCTGLSTADAGWLYSMAVRGDVVEYTGTDRPMEPDNGYGDWNIPFGQYGA